MNHFGPVWDKRFYDLSLNVAEWSKDPDKQVGAVLVSPDKREVCYGYNGMPVGFQHDEEYLKDKYIKLKYTIHAETNAILNARRDVTGWAIYCSANPCLDCAKLLAQTGLAALIVPPLDQRSKWYNNQRTARALLADYLIIHEVDHE